jgi:predicted transcriptional regulator
MAEMKLTASETRAQVLLAKHGDIGVADMAKKLRMPVSNTSRVISLLKEKGFISTEKVGISKTLSLSDAKHAALLRRLVLEFEHMPFAELLSGASLEVLSAVCCLRLKNRKEIRQNSLVSEASAARYLENLKQVGIVQKTDSVYKISPRFRTLSEFVIEFRHYLNRQTAMDFANDAVILWECNHEFILETDRSKKLGAFIPTGLSAFHRFGISLMVPKYYYFYSPLTRKLGLENAVLHSVLVPPTHRNMLATLLVLTKNMKEIDAGYLAEQGEKYGVRDRINDMTNYLRTKGAERPEGFPAWKEFTERAREYGLR